MRPCRVPTAPRRRRDFRDPAFWFAKKIVVPKLPCSCASIAASDASSAFFRNESGLCLKTNRTWSLYSASTSSIVEPTLEQRHSKSDHSTMVTRASAPALAASFPRRLTFQTSWRCIADGQKSYQQVKGLFVVLLEDSVHRVIRRDSSRIF